MTGLAVAAIVVAVVLVLAAIGLQVAEMRRRRRTSVTVAALQARIEELEAARGPAPATPAKPAKPAASAATGGAPVEGPAEPEFVITSIGAQERPSTGVERVDLSGPAFADAVVRESVVHAASLVHGVRRALSPQVRNRIAFEMRRELKRSRKARKVEVREALREYRARHRADVDLDDRLREEAS